MIADVLLGNFQNYTEGTDDAFYFGRFNQFEFYFQDSWKVRRNLTLELGVRYNFLPPWYNVLGDTSMFLRDLYNPAKAVSVSPADGSIVPNSGDPCNGLALFGSGFPDPAKGRIPQAADPSLQRLFVGLPRSGYAAQHGDISPRIGFAWEPVRTRENIGTRRVWHFLRSHAHQYADRGQQQSTFCRYREYL